ncbi:MAG: peptidase and matrixin and adamalysin [Acidobacteria bacterium]|jgi:hypothetical protein|nr:peptidase and matrixin and adamalysin [Acidobacteriota bacterium]
MAAVSRRKLDYILNMRKFFQLYLKLFLLIVLTVPAKAYVPEYSGETFSQKLHWKSAVIPISISSSLIKSSPNIKPGSDVEGAVRRSLEAWENVTNVTFEQLPSDKQSVSPAGNFGDGISLITIAPTSENVVMFGGNTEEVSAITRVFFNKKGMITEADIALNPYLQFSTDGSIGTFDLESTLTHEIGHLMGLEHSSVLGATMHESNGKNGVFNLESFDSRTLAETDISAVRSLYGAKFGDENCCAAIGGKLTAADGKPAKNYQVWAEEYATGKIIGELNTNIDGSFQFEMLPAGKYRVFAQNRTKAKNFKLAEEIGVVETGKGRSASLAKKLEQSPIGFEAQYIGFNGQLSERSVSLNAGKSYTIYIGGKNLNIKDYKFGFSSPFMSITPNSLFEHDFGKDVSVVSFEVKIKPQTALGEYSVFAESLKGQKSYVLGGLSIEQFENPWSNHSLVSN